MNGRQMGFSDNAQFDSERLTHHVRFSVETGHIHLFDQRMLLMHGAAFAGMRKAMIDRLGLSQTRELMTQLGYQQGVEDGHRIRSLGAQSVESALKMGPRLREIEGFVRNLPIDAMEVDADRGRFWGDYVWDSSWEAQAHLAHSGVCSEPVCWMMIGYADGYCHTVTGMVVRWREIECVGMGHRQCRVVGCTQSQWDAIDRLEEPSRQQVVVPRGQADPSAIDMGPEFAGVIGVAGNMRLVADMVRRVAQTNSTVLFRGESGVGKECFAQTLHACSRRAEGPMISVNCAAIPPDLVEAELFGVEKGAYTGADRERPGRFERAHGGTLFLDEVVSLSLAAQGKVLRAIQEREIERVGGTKVRKVDVRIVAAANRDLRCEVEAGRFRQDLFYRLNVFPIEIPPLRDRKGDIPHLIDFFLDRYTTELGKAIRGVHARAYTALMEYDWPGNVRELENMVERGVILADDEGMLDVHHLFVGGEALDTRILALHRSGSLVPTEGELDPPTEADERTTSLIDDLVDSVASFEDLEALVLQRALAKHVGNVSAAARSLNMKRGQFEYRLRKRQ